MDNTNRALVSIEDRTYSFALVLIRAFRAVPPRDQADRVIWQQLLKSGTSAGANSAEGGGSQSRADWITKRFIALKEMRETLLWLRLLHDTSNKPAADLPWLLDEANQLVAILTATVRSAKANRNRTSNL
jgi:four helix bundle protein